MTYKQANPESIKSLFDDIAPRYDRANSLLSFHMHALWNRKLASAVLEGAPTRVLDLCAGTGEISWRIIKRAQKTQKPLPELVLVDFSSNMIEVAKKKCGLLPTHVQEKCSCHVADATQLPFEEESFDTISCAYGIRNVCGLERCFSEARRVLRLGGTFHVLELTRPRGYVWKKLHALYLQSVLPCIGKYVTSNQEAYEYLHKSIQSFIPPEDIIACAENVGFQALSVRPLTFGIATLLQLQKK